MWIAKLIRPCAVARIAVLIFVISGARALGCSFAEGTLFPSNYDRVKEADAIVLVDALSIERPPGIAYSMPKLTLRTIEAIKDGFAGGTVQVSPVSSCFDYDFGSAVGQRLLLFLKKADGTWFVSGSPLGWINEQSSGANGPWEAVVRHYARIDQLNNYEQEKVELRNLQEAARVDRRNYPAGVDQDIKEHLSSPYPAKSYKDLMELYTKGTTTQRQAVLWAFARGKHKEARDLMQSLMRSSEFPAYTGPITAYVNATRDYSSIDALGGAYLGIADKQSRWPIMVSLIQLARQENMGLMLAVLKAADIEEAGRISTWFVRHPDDEATQIIRKLTGSQFDEEWELARSLAALGDQAVIAYARETIAATQGIDRRARLSLGDNPVLKRGLAIDILTQSPLPEADALIRDVVSRGDIHDIADICEGLLSSLKTSRWEMLRAIPNLRAVDDAHDHSITRTLENLVSGGDVKAKSLLAQLKAETGRN